MISDEKREMASAGTLLSDLGSGAPDGDNDLVQRILADLNTTESPSNPVMSPPAGNGRVISSPNPNTTYPLAMDPATATAHMIGKTYPTPGDFANMMGPGGAPYSGGQQQQYPQQQQQQGQQYQQQQPILASLYGGGGKGWMADLMTQIRQPLLVAILVFVMSLPVINVMLAFYLPSLLRATGELSTMGLLAKSLLAGALYWTILNVVAPLVSS
jgi:hypothetical protein